MDSTHKTKNIKISTKHHNTLKSYCDERGVKLYRVVEKLIEENCKPKKRDIYGE